MFETMHMTEQTILIIEDDALLRGLLSDLLVSEGAKARCCANGDAALAIANKQCFEVYVVGYRLQAMNGVELTKKLRACCPSSYIIGISLSPKGPDFLEAGADAFLLKPFETRQLIAKIDAFRSER